MPCGVCREAGHYAGNCTSPIIATNAQTLAQSIITRIDNHRVKTTNLSPGTLYKTNDRDRKNIYHTIDRSLGIDHIRATIIEKRMNWIDSEMLSSNSTHYMTWGGEWTVPLLSKVLPLMMDHVRDHIVGLSPAYSSVITDYNRLRLNPERSNTKKFYRSTIAQFLNFVIRAITPDSFLDIYHLSINDLCRAPVRSNDDVIRDAVRNLVNLRDVPHVMATIKTIRRVELDRAAQQALSAQNRAVSRAIARTRRERVAVPPRIVSRIKFRMDVSATKYTTDDACPICMETLSSENTVAMSCSHGFCSSCTGEFINRCNGKCPSCRETITEVRFKPDLCPESFNSLVSAISN